MEESTGLKMCFQSHCRHSVGSLGLEQDKQSLCYSVSTLKIPLDLKKQAYVNCLGKVLQKSHQRTAERKEVVQRKVRRCCGGSAIHGQSASTQKKGSAPRNRAVQKRENSTDLSHLKLNDR